MRILYLIPFSGVFYSADAAGVQALAATHNRGQNGQYIHPEFRVFLGVFGISRAAF